MSWQVLYPGFLARLMNPACIEEVHSTASGDEEGGCVVLMRALGISEVDIATMLMTIYWGMTASFALDRIPVS
jgi:hypothetical protein